MQDKSASTQLDISSELSNNGIMVQNSTPLDSSMNIPDFAQTQATSTTPTKKKFKFDDIYLIFSGVLFVLSLGLMINSRNFTATSDAKATRDLTVVPRNQTVNKSFPKSYKEEKIPTTVYQNLTTFADIPAKGSDEYVKTQIIKFYVYKDILQESRDSTPAALIPKTYKDIYDGVQIMEPIIKDNLLSKAFFGYIQATFAGMTDESSLKEKYGDLNGKAKAIIKRYQQLFVAGSYSPNQIIDISNKDEELLLLNNREQNKFVDDYDSTKTIFSDKGFNDFIFSQQQDQLSDIYTLLDENKNPQAYIIVYPSKLIIKKYSTLEKLIEDRASNFAY